MAVNWVKTLGGQIEPGTIYHGKIRRLAEFGLFVELVPGLDGLCMFQIFHVISNEHSCAIIKLMIWLRLKCLNMMKAPACTFTFD